MSDLKERIAIYPGSFDPFTNGHLDIVKKVAALFDEVYVVIGANAKKNRSIDALKMKAAIEQTMQENGLHNVVVAVYDGLVAQYAKTNGIRYMIRGLRNNMDYNYEENIAEVNKLINPDMEYVYFRAENVAAELYDNVREHIPSQLMASGDLYDGWVVAVEKEPYLVLAADGKWVEDPDHVTLLFTVEADVPDGEVMTTLVGTQEIRIGRPGYNLKTEYLEFRETVIVDIHWENWAPPAERETKK